MAMLSKKDLAQFLRGWYIETVWRSDWYGARTRLGSNYSVHKGP